MKREAASFLNLDLELNASTGLSRLAKHLEDSAFILYSGPVKGAYRLCAEPLIRGNLSKSARACTAHFLDVLEALPKDLAALFKRCKSRVFDYGFDGGLESKPLSVNLPPAHLARIAHLGVQVRITVYPHRPAADA
jgi:hypothetical protein